jgi:hypothetical protein
MDQDEPAGTPPQAAGAAAAAGSSPALAPTPHNIVDSVMQRNAMYESPPVVPAAAAVPAPSAAPTAAQEAAAAAAAGQLSPASALAALLAPMLVATIQQIDSEKQQAAEAAAIPTGGLSSPAEFYRFPQADAMSGGAAGSATPGASSDGPSPSYCSHDGVPRTVDGIPALTPHTVTVRRGSFGGGLGALLEEDGDFKPAANLFDSFSPDAGASPASVAGGFSPAAMGAVAAAEQAAAEAGAAPAATPAADFSFFPATSSHQHQQYQAPAGVTPEMGGGAAAAAAAAGGSMGGPAPNMISPEILGYYEQEAQRQRAAAAAATAAAAVPSSSQALGTPALPRSAAQRP